MVSEAVARVCSLKKVFLKFGKIHKKTPVLESFFDKVAGLLLRFHTEIFHLIKKGNKFQRN